MAIDMVYHCAGLPGKKCAAELSEEAAFVPPFAQISLGVPTVAQLTAAVLCDSCAGRYLKEMGARRMYRLRGALVIAVKHHYNPSAVSLGDLLVNKFAAESVEAAEQVESAVRRSLHRVRRREENNRLCALAQRATA
jgi:hypothetical protein